MADTASATLDEKPGMVPNDTPPEAEAKEKPESLWKDVWYSLCGNKAAMISLVFIALLVVIAVTTALFPSILPYDPYEQDLSQSFAAPSAAHWCGTDQQGRDIFSRILVGTQISLTVGLLAVAISLSIGVTLGAIAGYKGGIVDTVIMRIMDVMLAIPSILLAIAFMAALGTGIDKAVVAIGLVSIPEYARIVRSQILSVKQDDYVAAARVIGDKDSAIIFRHILPNVMPSIIVRATLGISGAILDCAALGFLGLGVQPPAAEWGDMLGRGRNYIFSAPYTMIYPGLAITLTVLAFNLLGDGIRDAIDPKSRRK
ncbi:MAG: ABC transporter permease [Atopobiaceae bacterium]|jgi:peptide/nickel transport system permease protein|nr:ABC transporter permease [Atopobiaceae bacterium]MCH4180760.1 ABC transporter permease [Atopobiaceae bacterium]MCH4214475.1 ABC transporter permease [Atopobiaceae bacterium]MCH4229405.1 ABC transporter permease [Atopobiaceae bacterium]MCH4276637.1 ABC transporter permease [Atopobiaceae bacterium]